MMANLWNMAFGAAREAILAGRVPPPPRQSASLSAAPLFHIGGVSSIVGGPMGGTKIVLMRKWDVEEALRLAREEQVTGFGGVPDDGAPDPRAPAASPSSASTSGRCPMGGAAGPARPPAARGRGVRRRRPDPERLRPHGDDVGGRDERRAWSSRRIPTASGRPNLTADVRVVDADGTPLGVGEIGEICIRSPQVVQGLLERRRRDGGSVPRRLVPLGRHRLRRRRRLPARRRPLKDVVIRGGENVYCVEVEAVLHEHPAVAEVAVVGLDERAMGERVCAVVVPRPGADVDLADLRGFAPTRLAGFKCPEALYVTDELPKTATGKVAKAAVRSQVADAAGTTSNAVW